ncbi:MAG: CvpA family protein [Terriglobales bacterium]
MTGADWLIVAVVLLSVVLAALQGFFYEVFSLAGVVVGYLVAAWGYTAVAAWYAPYVSAPWVAAMAGFLTIFVAIVIVAGICGRVARSLVKEVGLRWFDRILGAMFGLVRGVLLVMVFVLAVASFAPNSGLLARSSMAPYLLVVARAAVWLAPSQVRQQFRAGADAINNLREGKPAAGKTSGAPNAEVKPAPQP